MHQNVKEAFKHLGLRVELENDVNCATLAEKWKGHAKACQHFLTMNSFMR
ncbi:ROK family protein [Bacillus sp. NPDC077027]